MYIIILQFVFQFQLMVKSAQLTVTVLQLTIRHARQFMMTARQKDVLDAQQGTK